MIKNEIPEMQVMTDIALDPYSSDGHDGLVDRKTGKILNDETLDILARWRLFKRVLVPYSRTIIWWMKRGVIEASMRWFLRQCDELYCKICVGVLCCTDAECTEKIDKKTYQMNPTILKKPYLKLNLIRMKV